MKNAIEKIGEAMSDLGVLARVTNVKYLEYELYRVEVAGEYFGIYDTGRETFVD